MLQAFLCFVNIISMILQHVQTVFEGSSMSLLPYIHKSLFPQTQVLDLRQVELVYGSSFFKSIETGGNVSKALVRVTPN